MTNDNIINSETSQLGKGYIKNYSQYFNTFFTLSIIYALISVVLIYKNFNGIGKTLFAILSCVYSIYSLKKSNVKIKNGSKVLMLFTVLLGISIFNTSDMFVVIVNEYLMFISLIVSIMRCYVEDNDWQLIEYIKSFAVTVVEPILLIGRITPTREANYLKKYYDYNDYGESEKKNFNFIYILIGLAVSLCLLMIVLPLLFSADMIFEKMITNALTALKIKTIDMIGIAVLFVTLLLVSFCIIKYLNLWKLNDIGISRMNKLNDLLGVTILVVMSVVYVTFSLVQIFGLFLNKLQLPAGETFSSYARSGFFQLLSVASINLLMIVVAFYLFNKSKIIKLLLTVISLSTYIMLASSAYRLLLYIKMYNMTELTLYAMCGLVLVFFGLTGAVIGIYSKKFKFVRYGFVILLTLWTIFSFMRPEYVVAKYNLTYSTDENLDFKYIASFSSDASEPIYNYIVHNNDSFREYFLNEDKGADNDGLKFNLSKNNYNKYRNMAKKILDKKN